MEHTFKIIGRIDLSRFDKYTLEFRAKQAHLKFLSARIFALGEERDSQMSSLYYETKSLNPDQEFIQYTEWIISNLENEIEDLQREYDSLRIEISLTRQIN